MNLECCCILWIMYLQLQCLEIELGAFFFLLINYYHWIPRWTEIGWILRMKFVFWIDPMQIRIPTPNSSTIYHNYSSTHNHSKRNQPSLSGWWLSNSKSLSIPQQYYTYLSIGILIYGYRGGYYILLFIYESF